MRQQLLDRDWILELQHDALPAGAPPELASALPASVPGCVHTALLAAQLIPDPFFANNEADLQWLGEQTWRYSCPFDVDEDLLAADHLELVLAQVDTIAEVVLNGQSVGHTQSLHCTYRFDLRDLPREHNTLELIFSSPILWAREQEARLGPLPHVETHPFNFIRKPAYHFGWDWGPCLVTSGLYEAPRLVSWSDGRLAGVRPQVGLIDTGAAWVRVEVDVACAAPSADDAEAALVLEAHLTSPEGVRVAAATHGLASNDGSSTVVGVLELQVPAPELWWPRGHGAQPLYTLELALRLDSSAEPLDTWTRPIGLRSVALDTSPDDAGSAFRLFVNGRPIFVLGANWIPDDVFLDRITEPRLRTRLEQAVAANLNLLRVWGGGIYESEAFYSLCDELGVMVWQDFGFACAMYPEEAPFDALVEAEARQQVTRLCTHPSLVLYSGCNENFWGYEDWGSWKKDVGARTWGAGFYLGLLPGVVAELDPSRPYWPGSPYSGEGLHPLDPNHGTLHIWDAWNQKDYARYHELRPRFAAEFGYQGAACLATLAEAEPKGVAIDPRQLEHRQKAPKGMQKLRDRLLERFCEAKVGAASAQEWVYLTQLNQARAVASGAEWFRSLAPHCSGVVYWQFNDCWPALSWSAVDSAGRLKLLWYATCQVYAPRLLSFQPAEGGLELVAINDSDGAWEQRVVVRRVDFDGRIAASVAFELHIAPRALQRCSLPAALAVPQDRSRELFVADLVVEANDPSKPHESQARRATFFFEVDKNLSYPAALYSVDADVEHGHLTLHAQSLLRDAALMLENAPLTAAVDTQLITLLPGESAVFRVTGLADYSGSVLCFRFANAFGG